MLRHPLTRFALLPALLAVPAFRLHQHIAFGSSLGEWQAYGPGAFLLGFGLWWAGWALGALLVAAALRTVIETAALGLAVADVPHAQGWRGPLEWTGHLLLYAGMPAWLAWRALGW